MKVLLSYIIPALLIGASLGFALGIWWPDETKSSVAVVERQYVRLDTSKEPAAQNIRSDLPALQFNDISRQPNIFEQLRLTYEIASQSDLDQLMLYLAQSYNHPDPLFNHNITSILLERVIAIDPFEALAFVHGHPSMNQNAFTSHVLTSWIRHDPVGAIDYFKSMTDQGLKRQIGARMLADPSLSDTGYLSEIETALGDQAERIGEQIRLSRLSPQAAFEEALFGTDRRRQQRMVGAITRWYRRDPDAAMGRLLGLTDQREKHELMQAVISMQARMDPEKALEMLDLYAPDDQSLQQRILPQIARQDPELALPRVEALISDTGNLEILGRVLSQWIQVDKEAALAYMANMPEQYAPSVFRQVSTMYMMQSPEDAMSWLMSLDEKFDKTAKLPGISILSQFPDMAESWLEKLDDQPVMHGALLSSMARERAQSNPRDALEWLEQYAGSPSYESARRSVLQNWARQDPRGFASLIQDDVADPAYQNLFQMASRRWMNADPSATLDWISSLPPSTAKANALSGAIPQLSDLEEAIRLLDDLPIESVESIKMQLAQSWLRREPNDMEEIITRLDLSELQADGLRKQLE